MPGLTIKVRRSSGADTLHARVTKTSAAVIAVVNRHVVAVHGTAKRLAMSLPASHPTNDLYQKLLPELATPDNPNGRVIGASDHSAFVEGGTGQRGASEAPKGPGPKPEGLSYNPEWPGMAAIPFLTPALVEDKDAFVADIEQATKKGMGG